MWIVSDISKQHPNKDKQRNQKSNDPKARQSATFSRALYHSVLLIDV